MNGFEAIVTVNGTRYRADLTKGIDLSIAVAAGPGQTNAYFAHPVRMEPYRSGDWIGSVQAGGPVNYTDIFFNPHGHGTHTESVGHISAEVKSINATLHRWMFVAQLITVGADGNGAIGRSQFGGRLLPGAEALLIRTQPLPQHTTQKWSGTSPTFLRPEAVSLLVDHGINHLLIDLPSIDPEVDGGALAAHRALWAEGGDNRTITELIRVPEALPDGLYLLNLQVAPFENDAAPSRPVVFVLEQ
jgi:kynurenine formamidase